MKVNSEADPNSARERQNGDCHGMVKSQLNLRLMENIAVGVVDYSRERSEKIGPRE